MKLKFRVWNGEKMISPDYIDRKGIAHWKENSIPETSDKVMLFTGVTDKNNIEIYEGDINQDGGVCIWDESEERCGWSFKYTGEEGDEEIMDLGMDADQWCEIIGNIYEK